MYVHICDARMYTYIPSKHRARNSFMTKPFLFNRQNNSFCDRFMILYNKGRFYNVHFFLLPDDQ